MSGPHRYHDQPEHLEHVLNDINEELYTTEHGLSFGAASLLRFLATVTWTSKKQHPEHYSTVNPKYSKIAGMARMTGEVGAVHQAVPQGAGRRALDQGHQYGRDGFREEDRIRLLWSSHRKLRAELIAVTKPDFFDKFDEDEVDLTSRKPKAKHDNRYWCSR